MKLRNLKIGTQLTIAFGLILVFVLVLGLISRHQANSLAKQTSNLYEHPYAVKKALGELKASVLSIHRGMKDMELSANKEEIEQNIQTIEKHKTTAFEQLDILKDKYLGPKSDIDKTYNCFVSWNVLHEETINLIKEGQIKEAMSRTKSSGIGGRKVDEILESIKVIDDFATNKANQFYLSADNLNKNLKNQLEIILIIIFGAIIVIIYYLNRNIRQPLIEIATVNKLFGEGQMDMRSKYSSSNEFGDLSASFNTMADTIQREMQLNYQAAKIAEVMLSEVDAHRFSHSLLVSLIENTDAQQGALYLLNDKKSNFELFEGVGLNNDWIKFFSSEDFDGEFGITLSTKKIHCITQIPEKSQFHFNTSFGKFQVSEILTIPVVLGNETVAIISLATIKSFSKSTHKLLESILTTISARMGGILAYRKMSDFSRQLEQQNIRLEAQKEELHILNNELGHKSEILIAANLELEQQRRELSEQARELTEQNIELEVQKKQLDESNHLKTIFLSNMSHELRTPLNSVIALSGVLSRRLADRLPEDEFNYLKIIERNGKQLLELINDILDLSRIEAGREEIEINIFNPKELIDEIVDLINPQAIQKNITLSFRNEKALNPIKSDFVKCRHILQNIVANAVKFTEKGGVEISAEEELNLVKIIISDTGIGIDNAYLTSIFDEFRQGDGSSSRKYGGTGLGLAIAKKYAEMLGGKIEVKSKINEGSVFTLILPSLQETTNETVQTYFEQFIPNNVSTDRDTSTKCILLVEDSEAVVIQLNEILTTEGYKILIARNGHEALQIIDKQIPDAMILDLMMPEVDGFEVLRRIREQEKTDKLPVIILTAKYVTKSELAFLKHNSIHQLIQKGDISKEQLINAVARLVFPDKQKEKSQSLKPTKSLTQALSILIVEDNLDNMITIKAMLDDKYQIIEAMDGISGVELAKTHRPSLILMDIALPGINGIDALKNIRKEESLKTIPVIAVSASAMKGDKEDFITIGFNDYVSKPIDNVLLINTISKYLH